MLKTVAKAWVLPKEAAAQAPGGGTAQYRGPGGAAAQRRFGHWPLGLISDIQDSTGIRFFERRQKIYISPIAYGLWTSASELVELGK